MIAEHVWISTLTDRFGEPSEGVRVGIGDDAAVLEPSNRPSVWTVDAAVEGVHFTFAIADAYTVGFRSMMAALSDLAAMGAAPRGVLSALTLPAGFEETELNELARGQREAAALVGTSVIGGNVSRGPCVSVTTTALGECRRPLLRSGATVGEIVWVCGALGMAAAGLKVLLESERLDERARACVRDELELCMTAWRRPHARISEALSVSDLATSGIDVSDGLAQDLGHVALASSVDIELDADALLQREPSLVKVCEVFGWDPLALILSGGEDYAVVVTTRASDDLTALGFARIGRVVASSASHVERDELHERSAVKVIRGGELITAPAGFDHGRLQELQRHASGTGTSRNIERMLAKAASRCPGTVTFFNIP
ncbi:MAG: thiamine-phosphate kinase [Polyangiaceae bacterium]